jgi:hypothetical protein
LNAIAGGNLASELSIGREFADRIAPRAEGRAFSQSVFINCPFDDEYKPLFQAAAFTVTRCGFIPRCAKETEDSSEPRLNKILRIIEQCRLGIHDLSRIGLDRGYPRFNMPFELGLFLGAKHYGRGAQDRKSHLIFERTSHTYERFISDLKGIDIACHGNVQKRIVQQIRNWLSSATPRSLPGGAAILSDYGKFKRWLPSRCQTESLRVSDLTWRKHVDLATEWTRGGASLSGARRRAPTATMNPN